MAYLLRPVPGGDVDSDLGDIVTGQLFDVVPISLMLLAAMAGLWLAFKNTGLGRGCYAAGSSESAAYMSGLDVDRSKLAAYALGRLLRRRRAGSSSASRRSRGDAHISGDTRCARSPPW